MIINMILATDDLGGIGKNGELPWPKNDADMKWFRDCTKGHVLVMGRKTWESLGCKKLPGRINVLLTTKKLEDLDGMPDYVYSGKIDDVLGDLREKYPNSKIWIIGGANIYQQSIPFVKNVYLTKFPGNYNCDTFVKLENILESDFVEMAKKTQNGLEFTIWSRL